MIMEHSIALIAPIKAINMEHSIALIAPIKAIIVELIGAMEPLLHGLIGAISALGAFTLARRRWGAFRALNSVAVIINYPDLIGRILSSAN